MRVLDIVKFKKKGCPHCGFTDLAINYNRFVIEDLEVVRFPTKNDIKKIRYWNNKQLNYNCYRDYIDEGTSSIKWTKKELEK